MFVVEVNKDLQNYNSSRHIQGKILKDGIKDN